MDIRSNTMRTFNHGLYMLVWASLSEELVVDLQRLLPRLQCFRRPVGSCPMSEELSLTREQGGFLVVSDRPAGSRYGLIADPVLDAHFSIDIKEIGCGAACSGQT